MARLLLFVLSLAAIAAIAHGDPTSKLIGVQDLTAASFDTVIDGKKAALIEFYAPWCGHCKSLVPEYKKLGELISKDPTLNSQVTIAKVDADEHRTVGERFGVQGFPTIKWFPRGRPDYPVDYQGGRDAESFVEFIKSQLIKDASYGQIIEFTVLAHKYADSDYKDSSVIDEAKKAADKAQEGDKANAAQYVKYFEKIAAKGKEYIDTEAARLQKLAAGGVAANKLTEINRKISILMTFKGTKGAAFNTDAAAEEEQPVAPQEDAPAGGEVAEGEEGYVGEPQDVEFLGYEGEDMMIRFN